MKHTSCLNRPAELPFEAVNYMLREQHYSTRSKHTDVLQMKCYSHLVIVNSANMFSYYFCGKERVKLTLSTRYSCMPSLRPKVHLPCICFCEQIKIQLTVTDPQQLSNKQQSLNEL